MCKQWVSHLLYSCLHSLFFSNWESHGMTNFPTDASRNGLSENVSSHNSTTIPKIIRCYPHCPSTKLCQGKQVPFANYCLVKQQMRMTQVQKGTPFCNDPAPKCMILVCIFRNETKSDSLEPRRFLGREPAA